jgi:hypothetical protein
MKILHGDLFCLVLHRKFSQPDKAIQYDGEMELHTSSIVESGEEILTVPGLALAALAWIENPVARQVYRIVPNGPAVWEQVGEVPEAELRACLPAHF